VQLLAAAAEPSNLIFARFQMALSLGWHIVVACLGVGFPPVILIAEALGLRRGDTVHRGLARRWARAAAVLFAVGAVSGTILSFEMGILWPGLMGGYGSVFGLPFALEGFAFFIEAIFIGIYLYGWDRLSPRRHLLTGMPVVVAGVLSAFFVVCANSWMNDPQGFRLVGGRAVDPDPIAAMFNPATPVQTTHMILAAIMVTGFAVAAVHAVGLLGGRRGPGQRAAFLIPFHRRRPLHPGADRRRRRGGAPRRRPPAGEAGGMEAQVPTEVGADEHVGGIIVDGRLRGALIIPHGLSLLLTGTTHARVPGLDAVPADQRPPANVVHLAFDLMVGTGFALLALGGWLGLAWWRRRDLPRSRWFLRAAVAAGPAAVAAMEAGWVTTEVGRQPWIVYRVLRTADAVNTAPGLAIGLFVLIAVYTLLTACTVYVLRRLGPVASS